MSLFGKRKWEDREDTPVQVNEETGNWIAHAPKKGNEQHKYGGTDANDRGNHNHEVDIYDKSGQLVEIREVHPEVGVVPED